MEQTRLSGLKLKETDFYLDKNLVPVALMETRFPVEFYHRIDPEEISILSQAHPVCVVSTRSGFKVVAGVQTYRLFCVVRDLFVAANHDLVVHIFSEAEGKLISELELSFLPR